LLLSDASEWIEERKIRPIYFRSLACTFAISPTDDLRSGSYLFGNGDFDNHCPSFKYTDLASRSRVSLEQSK